MTLQNDEIKLAILQDFTRGDGVVALSRKYDISHRTISDFLLGKTHKAWWEEYNKGEVVQVSDSKPSKVFNRKPKVAPVKIETSQYAPAGCTHLFIPDLQVKPNIDMQYLSWIGQYIAHKKPDVIINIGDHFDLPSLSSYDKGTKKAEGKHLAEDIESGIIGMNLLLQPLADLQEKQRQEHGKVLYKPKMVFTIGNHEQRLERHLNANPELTDLVSYADFKLEENGWEVYDFLEPAVVNGVMYIHYIPNPMTGRPYGGSALNILNKIGCSASCGHVQKLDIATRHLPTGQQQWLMVCGAGYPHNEGYKGYTGNKHFRGIVMKHRVHSGNYNPMVVSLDYLEEKYGQHN